MLFTSEQVSAGHPDKICDQISDAIVMDCLKHDRNSRVAVEALIKENHVVVAGEITSKHEPDIRRRLLRDHRQIARELDPFVLLVDLLIDRHLQRPVPGRREVHAALPGKVLALQIADRLQVDDLVRAQHVESRLERNPEQLSHIAIRRRSLTARS